VFIIYPLGGPAFFTASLSISLRPPLGQKQNFKRNVKKRNVKTYVTPSPILYISSNNLNNAIVLEETYRPLAS